MDQKPCLEICLIRAHPSRRLCQKLLVPLPFDTPVLKCRQLRDQLQGQYPMRELRARSSRCGNRI